MQRFIHLAMAMGAVALVSCCAAAFAADAGPASRTASPLAVSANGAAAIASDPLEHPEPRLDLSRLAQSLAERSPDPVPAATPLVSASPARSAAPPQAPADPPILPLDENEQLPLGGSSASSSDSASNGDSSLFTGGGSAVLSTLTALGVVIGLILLLKWAWSRMGGQVVVGTTPVVEVLSRTSVAPRNHILLVRVGQRVLVVGDSAAGLRTLASVEEPEEVAELLTGVSAARDNSVSRNFSQLLTRFHGDFDGAGRLSEEGGDHREHLVDRARDSVSGLVSRIRTISSRGGGG